MFLVGFRCASGSVLNSARDLHRLQYRRVIVAYVVHRRADKHTCNLGHNYDAEEAGVLFSELALQ
jgi:hypothetical protein